MNHFYMVRSSTDSTDAGIRIHYVEDKPDKPHNLMVLLHGFPQFWYAWKEYLPAFSEKGFHVVAPDMRGYNESDKPKEQSAYDIEYLKRDVLELIHHCGYEKAVVVGHDWGGAVTWELAEHHPEVIEAAIVVNAPHRGAFAANLRESRLFNLRQMVRSWYIYFFQLPYLPERVMQLQDFSWLEYSFRSWSTKENTFSEKDIEAYKKALRKPGALTATINYYRANTTGDYGKGIVEAYKGNNRFRTIEIPVLLLWGDQDPPLDIRLTRHLEDFCSDKFREVHFAEASHWVLHEYPSLVVEEIDHFLNEIL